MTTQVKWQDRIAALPEKEQDKAKRLAGKISLLVGDNKKLEAYAQEFLSQAPDNELVETLELLIEQLKALTPAGNGTDPNDPFSEVKQMIAQLPSPKKEESMKLLNEFLSNEKSLGRSWRQFEKTLVKSPTPNQVHENLVKIAITIEKMEEAETRQKEAAAAAAPQPDPEEEEGLKLRLPGKNLFKMISRKFLIGAAIALPVLVVILIAVTLLLKPSSPNTSNLRNLEPVAPAAEVQSAQPVEEVAPVEVQPAAPAKPSTIDEAAEKIIKGQTWFNSVPEEQPTTTDKASMFKLPSSLPNFFGNKAERDWGVVLWLTLAFTIMGYVVKERMREQQPSDVRLIKVGYIVFFVMTLLDLELATMVIRRGEWVVGNQIAADVNLVKVVIDSMAVIIALVLFTAAAISIKSDLTPLSGGLMTLGMIFILMGQSNQLLKVIGVSLFVLGLITHLFELSKQEGTAGAIGTVVGMIPVFIVLRVAIDLLLGLITLMPAPPTSWSWVIRDSLAWLINVPYANRGLIAFALAYLISYRSAEGVAEMIFGRMLKADEQEEGSLVGRMVPTEETAAIDTVILFIAVVVLIWIAVGNPLTPISFGG